MEIHDNIYGTIKVSEPVLLELLDLETLKRLKKISQYGVPDKYYFKKNFNRYEHSVGVMLLLKKLGASIEEQVAGLLHDASVTSFSHVSDWVFSDGHKGNENYHDTIHESFLKQTKIPKILEKYSLSVDRILNDGNFSLLENDLPDICADRVDYSLREFYHTNGDLTIVKKCLNSLIIYKGKMIFSDVSAAGIFANTFLDLQIHHWGSVKAVKRYFFFSEALKIAIKKNILSKNDFWKSEALILEKIEKSNNSKIAKDLKILKSGDFPRLGQKVHKKFRYVDPYVLTGDKLEKISTLDKDFQERLQKEHSLNLEGVSV